MKAALREPEEFLQGQDVEMILVQRILELGVPTVDGLRPHLLPPSAEDPSVEIFRLDHEDAEAGRHHVIDLCGTRAIGMREIEVVEDLVNGRVQITQAPGDHLLALLPARSPGLQGHGHPEEAHEEPHEDGDSDRDDDDHVDLLTGPLALPHNVIAYESLVKNG